MMNQKRTVPWVFYMVLMLTLSAVSVVSFAETRSGSLRSPGDTHSFSVDTGTDELVELSFTYPKGAADFWVKVVGEDRTTVLGDFDLDNGTIIQLIGGGVFYVSVYSRAGIGSWKVDYSIDEAMRLLLERSDLENNGVMRYESDGRVTVTGELSGAGDEDVIYLVSDAADFFLDFPKPFQGGSFSVDLVNGDGKSNMTFFTYHNARSVEVPLSGGFFVKISSPGAGGAYSFSYENRPDRLVRFSNYLTVSHAGGTGTADRVELIVPVIESFEDYQDVLESTVNLTNYSIITDNYGNHFYRFEFLNIGPKAVISVEMDYLVRMHGVYDVPDVCSGEVIDEFLEPEPLIESNRGFVVDTARRVTAGDNTLCGKAGSIYWHVLSSFTYQFQGPMMGAFRALGSCSGDCNEYTDSILALARAVGIPARKGNGYVYFGTDDLDSHAFSEVYLPGAGWSIADATMCCYRIRPPIYVYAYTGENPTAFEYPDIEDYHYRIDYSGPEPNIVISQEFFIREVPDDIIGTSLNAPYSP